MAKFIPSTLQTRVERFYEITQEIKHLEEQKAKLLHFFKKYNGKTVVGVEHQASVYEQKSSTFQSSVARKFLTPAQYAKCLKKGKHLRVRISELHVKE